MAKTGTMLTFQEFEQLPDRPGKSELLRGELIESPPAKLRHNRISERIYKALDAALEVAHAKGQAQDVGEACHEMGYYLVAHSWVQPDASVTHAGQKEGEYFENAPAIAVEVISPGNTADQVATKTELYFEFGAREVWRFYPEQRHVVVHLGRKSETLTGHDTLRTPLIPGFAMSVAEILA